MQGLPRRFHHRAMQPWSRAAFLNLAPLVFLYDCSMFKSSSSAVKQMSIISELRFATQLLLKSASKLQLKSTFTIHLPFFQHQAHPALLTVVSRLVLTSNRRRQWQCLPTFCLTPTQLASRSCHWPQLATQRLHVSNKQQSSVFKQEDEAGYQHGPLSAITEHFPALHIFKLNKVWQALALWSSQPHFLSASTEE